MSRAALWKQHGRVQEREELADSIFRTAFEEGQKRHGKRTISGRVPSLWGCDDGTFHWNPVLLRNTIQSPYFQRCCEKIHDWNAMMNEIYYEVKHVQPFSDRNNQTPSTAFCLLLRLLLLRMTSDQVQNTITHADSPYIRCIGFLFIRYYCSPDSVTAWIEPFLHDPEPVVVEFSKTAPTVTVGEYVSDLFRSDKRKDYYGTTLPRYPAQVERDLMVLILQNEQIRARAARHWKNTSAMKLFTTVGSTVMALYGDEENPLAWYEAVVDRVISVDADSDTALTHPRFVVHFPAYGNTETVKLGEIDFIDSKERRNNESNQSAGCGGRGRGQPEIFRGEIRPIRHPEEDLYEEVRRRERESVTSDKNWARKPPTTKAAMSTISRYAVMDDIDQPSTSRHPRRLRQQPSSSPPSGHPDSRQKSDDKRERHPPFTAPLGEPPRKRTADELAAIDDKKRRLMAKYG